MFKPYTRHHILWFSTLLVCALVLTGCVFSKEPNPYFNAAKPHHTPTGFQNNYGGNVDKSLLDVVLWQISRKPLPPKGPIPTATPNLAAALPNITWVGHSTMLLQLDSLRVITDPQFSNRASPVQWAGPKRLNPPALTVAQLPKMDVVLITHNHYDHLDKDSVLALNAQAGSSPMFIVPLGIKPWLKNIGINNVVELDWWDSHTVKGVDFVFTPAQHWSSRTPFDNRTSLWGGFAIVSPDLRVIYTGDTAYSKDFKDIATHFSKQTPAAVNFDLALIPVGCYEPRDFMRDQHINPTEAVQIHQDLGSKRSIGVHWGTFADLCDEPLDQAPIDLAKARQAKGLEETAFTVMKLGETRVITK